MSANRLYHTWFERIRQMRPGERITRLRNLAWLMVGIFQNTSVHLSDIASKIPSQGAQHCSRPEPVPYQPSSARTGMARARRQEPVSVHGPDRG